MAKKQSKFKMIGQGKFKRDAEPIFLSLRLALGQRKDLWIKSSIDARRRWIESDIVLALAWNLYRFLERFFDGM